MLSLIFLASPVFYIRIYDIIFLRSNNTQRAYKDLSRFPGNNGAVVLSSKQILGSVHYFISVFSISFSCKWNEKFRLLNVTLEEIFSSPDIRYATLPGQACYAVIK